MRAKGLRLLAGLAGLALLATLLPAQDKTGARAADVAAVKKMIADFVLVFDKGDAKAVAAFWTADGEFITENGLVLKGRDAIEKAYAAHLAKRLPGKLELEIESVRFPSADTAIIDLTLRRKNADGQTVASSQSQSFLARENGQWKLAVVHEWERDVTADQGLADLAWLIGAWSAANQEKEVELRYAWHSEQKGFIQGGYTVKQGGKVIESGTQMIGKDNLHGVIRSWAFQGGGGFGGGTWARDGQRWLVESAGVLSDGQEMTATYVFTPIGKDAFTWQAIDRTLGGVALPNTEPIKVTRKK